MRQLTPSRKSPLKAMSRRGLPVLFAVALGSIFVSLLAPTAHAQAGPPLVYHQISAFTDPIIDGGAGAPILSRDGQEGVVREGSYLPLTVDIIREELRKLE